MALLMSTHNICFQGKIRKIFNWLPLLSGAMNKKYVYISFLSTLIPESHPTTHSSNFKKVLIFFLFLHEISCEYSLEVPHGDASNEFLQHMFSSRNKKKKFLDSKCPKTLLDNVSYTILALILLFMQLLL